MKTSIIMAGIILAANFASATIVPMGVVSRLKTVKSTGTGILQPTSGILTVNQELGSVTIQINTRVKCRNGMCPRIAARPIIAHLPIIGIQKDRCNNSLLLARKITTHNPPPGAAGMPTNVIESVRVIDHSTNTCQMAPSQLGVAYTRVSRSLVHGQMARVNIILKGSPLLHLAEAN